MLPVIQFSSQVVDPLIVDGLTVGQLLDLPAPIRLLHDLATRRSLLVDVGLARRLARAADAPADAAVMDTPVGAALAFGQSTAHWSVPAPFVAAAAVWQRVGMVVVEDDDHRPLALFSPSMVAEELAHTSLVDSAGRTADVLGALEQRGLGAALQLVGETFAETGFHSERLNSIAPYAPWCQGSAGHWVAFCPCEDHPGAQCRRRSDLQ